LRHHRGKIAALNVAEAVPDRRRYQLSTRGIGGRHGTAFRRIAGPDM